MLDPVPQTNDWKSKYQAALDELDARQREWAEIEGLLRKAIGRLSIAGRGLDARLDEQLELIRELSREKRNDKLAQALEALSQIVATLDDPQYASKQRRADPVMFLLELLHGIHFDKSQRRNLREICSELLKSVAQGHERDVVTGYIHQLAALINENFDNLEVTSNSAKIVFQLLDLLDLDAERRAEIHGLLQEADEFREAELHRLAAMINAQLGGGGDSSIDEVMSTLLERLAIVQGANDEITQIQAKISDGVSGEAWVDTLNDIVGTVSDSLQKLDHEKRELEAFIVSVTEQLGEITELIVEGHKDHQSDHDDTQSLHSFVREGMSLIQKNFQTSTDLKQLKDAIGQNIDQIRGGVDDFVDRINQRHAATEERNQRLTEQLTQMEMETQTLQYQLKENRVKLLHDALTGVYSRVAYDERIEQELARWNRYRSPFSYVIVDLDHFKRINDTWGHSAGDKALKIIAQLMQDYVRKSDAVFRIGGEEFVLLLTDTAAERADQAIAKMREAIAESSFHFKGEPVQITLSAGITETRPGDDAESIYERADQALYKAKRSGRNCQFVAD